MRMADFLRSRLFAIMAAAALALVVAGAAAWFVLAPATRSMAGGEALVGGPFMLIDQHGEERTQQDFAGRYMLIYFGYTYCPDFCPMSLSNMTRAMDLLPPEAAEQVVPVFITIDPERDTVAQLAEYAPLFHPRLVALTGSPEATKQAAQAYRVYFAKAGDDDSDAYLMDHSTFIYLMGPDGRYVRHFAHNASPEEMAAAIEAAIAEG
jgi:cytochrome oxidase Cu insertion factor (SCO1/SenC/PrrC family)